MCEDCSFAFQILSERSSHQLREREPTSSGRSNTCNSGADLRSLMYGERYRAHSSIAHSTPTQIECKEYIEYAKWKLWHTIHRASQAPAGWMNSSNCINWSEHMRTRVYWAVLAKPCRETFNHMDTVSGHSAFSAIMGNWTLIIMQTKCKMKHASRHYICTSVYV